MSDTNVTAVNREGQHPIDSFFPPDSMPSVWCPGCGIGTIVYTFVQAVEEMNVEPDKICVVCGGNIISRQDDNVATIQNRLKVYKEKTEPVKNFYLQKGQFFEVDGNKSVDKVYNDILELVKKTE